MALRAGIDIGTNTILLLVAEVENGEVTHVLEDNVRVVRLGQGVDQNRAFHPEALERARACFRDYSERLKKYPGIDVRAVATSGSRDARNSPEFFEEVRAKYGIPVRVISGEEEALLSFKGALPDGIKDPHSIAVLDIGGGSTEAVGLRPNSDSELFRYSFDMGCVRLSERYLKSNPPLASEIQELVTFVKADLAKKPEILDALKGRTLVAVAGTATYLASASLGLTRFDPEKVHGHILTRAAIQELIAKFAKLTSEQRLGLGGMDKGRADVILAGAFILDEVLARAGLSSVQTSVRGLRYGAVLV